MGANHGIRVQDMRILQCNYQPRVTGHVRNSMRDKEKSTSSCQGCKIFKVPLSLCVTINSISNKN